MGLPLQRSLLDRIDRAPEAFRGQVELDSYRLGATLDDRGDLYLDPTEVRRLAAELGERLRPDVAGAAEAARRMEAGHRQVCGRLGAAVQAVREAFASGGAPLPPGEGRGGAERATELWGELGEAIRQELAYGLLARFVPDAVLRALSAAGDRRPPPFPRRTAGGELAVALADLAQRCSAAGFPPRRLAACWPQVPGSVAETMTAFRAKQSGFGPLAWDAPGYEDAPYVIGRLVAVFGEGDAGPPSSPRIPRQHVVGTEGDREPPTRGLLAYWLSFMEWETWYVRTAFFHGTVPLLRALAGQDHGSGVRAEDLLFARWSEVQGGSVDPSALALRRDAYERDVRPRTRHAISPGRLAAIVGFDPGRHEPGWAP